MRILLLGGYSSTNIGNAFYEMGAQYLLSQISDDIELIRTSDLSTYWWATYRNAKEGFEPCEHFSDVDYILWLGPVFEPSSMEKWVNVLKRAKETNTKIIVLSAGGMTYSDDEVRKCRDLMKEYPFYIMTSRDSETYEAYKDCFEYAYDGICTAFFSPFCFNKWEISEKPYAVVNFEKYKEPKFVCSAEGFEINGKKWMCDNTSMKHGLSDYILPGGSCYQDVIFGDMKIVRTKNTCMRPNFASGYKGTNVYLSDVPEDYLNIYANAEIIISDRVHTCVASLAQGKPVMFFGNTPRAKLFERILHGKEKCLSQTPVKADMDYVAAERSGMIRFLKDTLI